MYATSKTYTTPIMCKHSTASNTHSHHLRRDMWKTVETGRPLQDMFNGASPTILLQVLWILPLSGSLNWLAAHSQWLDWHFTYTNTVWAVSQQKTHLPICTTCLCSATLRYAGEGQCSNSPNRCYSTVQRSWSYGPTLIFGSICSCNEYLWGGVLVITIFMEIKA